jgi:hypothetical protein
MPSDLDLARDEWLAAQERMLAAEQELRVFEQSLAGLDVLFEEHIDRSASLQRIRDKAREHSDDAMGRLEHARHRHRLQQR